MKFDVRQYGKMLDDDNIRVIYNGPIWEHGIDSLAELLSKRLEHDDVPFAASQAVFSVFVEQVNNMKMYSAEKMLKKSPEGNTLEVSKGIFILGIQETTIFIRCGNLVTSNSAELLKTRIDHLNTLDKKGLRQYYKERMNAVNDNPESKGAGLGLIEIARRASSPIEYEFEPYDANRKYFSMYVIIQLGGTEQ